MNNIAVFDVCWTLYRSNTTVDFILFYLKQKNLFRYVYYRILTLRVVSFVLFRVFSVDLRTLMIKELEGESKESLLEISDQFYFHFLLNRKNELVFSYLIDLKRKGYLICLASASLDIVVSTIAKHNELDFVSSSLDFVNGFCTGELKFEGAGNKYCLLKEKYKIEKFFCMYSDNPEDLEISDKFDFYYRVINSRVFKKPTVVSF